MSAWYSNHMCIVILITLNLIFFIMLTTAHLNQEATLQKKKSRSDYNHCFSLPGSSFRLILVIKMTTNSGATCPFDVLAKVLTLAVGNPEGFKGLRGHDNNATGGLTWWDLLLITP